MIFSTLATICPSDYNITNLNEKVLNYVLTQENFPFILYNSVEPFQSKYDRLKQIRKHNLQEIEKTLILTNTLLTDTYGTSDELAKVVKEKQDYLLNCVNSNVGNKTTSKIIKEKVNKELYMRKSVCDEQMKDIGSYAKESTVPALIVLLFMLYCFI